MNLEEPSIFPEDTPMQNHEADELPEVMLHEMYEKATEVSIFLLHTCSTKFLVHLFFVGFTSNNYSYFGMEVVSNNVVIYCVGCLSLK